MAGGLESACRHVQFGPYSVLKSRNVPENPAPLETNGIFGNPGLILYCGNSQLHDCLRLCVDGVCAPPPVYSGPHQFLRDCPKVLQLFLSYERRLWLSGKQEVVRPPRYLK